MFGELDTLYGNMKQAERELRDKMSRHGVKKISNKTTLTHCLREYKRWIYLYRKWETAEDMLNLNK